MESWDSSAPDNGQIYSNIGVTVMSNGRPPLLPKPKKTSNGTKSFHLYNKSEIFVEMLLVSSRKV